MDKDGLIIDVFLEMKIQTKEGREGLRVGFSNSCISANSRGTIKWLYY